MMRIQRLFPAIAIVLALSACSSEQIYEGVRENREAECRKLVNLQEREDCMARLDKSYDEYERERRGVLEDDARN